MIVEFVMDGAVHSAKIGVDGHIFTVLAQDKELHERFGELIMVEANGDFAWHNLSPAHYRYAYSVAIALKQRLGFGQK